MNRFKALQDDIVIVVMGPTGSGKTNFINSITGNPEKANAASLMSGPLQVTPYAIVRNGWRVVLVDTPGFDDTIRPNMDILIMITNWLSKKYPNSDTIRITGMLYLHRITDNRMSGPTYETLQMFGQLCATIPPHRACLVTTMWDHTSPDVLKMLENREAELVTEFWRPLIAEGVLARRFTNTAPSAFRIIDELVGIASPRDDLLLQEELVKQKNYPTKTETEKFLYSRLQKLLLEQKNTLMNLEVEAKLQNHPSLVRGLQVEHDQINARLQKTFEQMQEMKVPFSRRVFARLFEGRSLTMDEL